MKLIFAGTPHFAAAALAALVAAGHEILLVLTQPDRPAGRGMKLCASEVAQVAHAAGLRIEKPLSLKDLTTQTMLRECNADLMVVAAYSLLLPQAVLDIPRLGCLNIHGSILPRWRGAAPVQRAIEAGDTETGIAIMQMDAGLDTGAVLLEKRIAISDFETSATLFEKLTRGGAESIVHALASLSTLSAAKQASDGATYAKKVLKSEALINWSDSATVLERRIRAFDPFPGAEARYGVDGDATIKVWRAKVITNKATQPPGTIISRTDNQLIVQCGQDALSLNVVQKPGSKRVAIAEFLNGMAGHTPPNATSALQLGSLFK